MPNVHAYHVVPYIPPALEGLQRLAHNLRWAWNHEAFELFLHIDRNLWEQSGHNPVHLLSQLSQERLKELESDEAFLRRLERALRSLDEYLNSTTTWFQRRYADALAKGVRVAYFSMEFGLTECVPNYSGGLGVLAGDHLKSASDLNIPLVGVGLLYQQGYFRQQLNGDGWQQENYPENDFYHMPISVVNNSEGQPLVVGVEFPGRTVYAQVWKVQVGRVPLYLLDTNISPNNAADQNITDKLYGGDVEMRLRQELILGIGGMRALNALNVQPTLCHMNEGHSAFLSLERVRVMMEAQGVDFQTAREATAAGNLFTTHTPVPAGFDVFPTDLLWQYFSGYVGKLGISFEEFVALGRVNPTDSDEKFNMAILALHNSNQCNGVSKLHGEVSRKLVKSLFPGLSEDEVPVSHVTNGIHVRSYISHEMAALFDYYLGWRWSPDISDPKTWAKIDEVPDEELWRVRCLHREHFVSYLRNRLRQSYERRGMSEFEIRQVQNIFNPEALTIGFARRFATYKRATLFMRDIDRLVRLLNDSNRPVQIVLAGKSHPRDDGGKELIKQIVQLARRGDVRNNIVFLEDYDISVARNLVQGVDLWLNNPRRPMEASGTSGMKVLANGGLNCSILDGWWAEGYDPKAGWAIGRGEDYTDPEYQDHVESLALYDLLEKEIVPLFYDRGRDGVPHAWVNRIKNSMRLLCPVFNTHRMVAEYAEKFYLPASEHYLTLAGNRAERAQQLVKWRQKVQTGWGEVSVTKVETPAIWQKEALHVGMRLQVTAQIQLGGLSPSDIAVQAYYGTLDVAHNITHGSILPLVWQSSENGTHHYAGEIDCHESGMQGVSVRVVPFHPDATLPMQLPLVKWE